MLNKLSSAYKSVFRIADSVIMDNGTVVPCIQGQLSEVDVISQNGYRYRRGFWDKVINNDVVQDRIKSRDMLGMIEHPIEDDAYMKTPYELASHVILKAWVDDSGNPWGQFGLLNNPHGNALKALVDIGHQPGVSTRGMGDILQDSVSQYVTDDNYMLLTWDCVRNPNFATLKMERVSDSLRQSPVYNELLQMYHLRDSVDEHYDAKKLANEISGAISDIQQKLTSLQNLI